MLFATARRLAISPLSCFTCAASAEGIHFVKSLLLVVIYMVFIFAEQAVFRRKILSIAGERREVAVEVLDTMGRGIQRYLGVKTVAAFATGALCYAVLVFLEALLRKAQPNERRRIAHTLLDVFHYTPIDGGAPAWYAELLHAAQRLDIDAYKARLAEITPRLERGLDEIVDDPSRLTATPIPELWLVVDDVRIDVPRLGINSHPLVIDLNTAPLELLMSLPGVGLDQAQAIDNARRAAPFTGVKDLRQVQGLAAATTKAVRRYQWSPTDQ